MTATPQRILVVDDDPEIRKLLARYIESQGFRVLLAANCRELHDRLASHNVDLIVLDVMLLTARGWKRAAIYAPSARTFPSSCLPRSKRTSTASSGSRSAPTTISASRSTRAS
jgi:CheY-like chemotaxis protein